MGHSHSHSHHNGEGGDSSRNIIIAFFLNLIFAFIELIGGYFTNSVSIMSDALHDFGDCVSLAIAWGLQKKSNKRGDDKFSYGYKRFSLLGAIFMSSILLASSVFIISEAVERLHDPQVVNAKGMLWLAILGIAVNIMAALRLKKGSSMNERAVFIHIMEDVLGWVAVLIASVVMLFVDFPILDPILSIIITLWVLINIYKNLKSTFNVLLQGVPADVDIAKLSENILNVDGVTSIHDMHVWSFDGQTHAMTIHAVVDDNNDCCRIRKNIRDIALIQNIAHTTVEIDKVGELCEYLKRGD